MELDREEGERAIRIAIKKLRNKHFSRALKVACQAQRLYPELENLLQLLTICDVYCAAQAKVNRDLDLYAILQVEVTADGTVIRRQYDKLAFYLRSDKNTVPGAEAALKLVSEAYTTLCNQIERSLYDMKRQHASREVANKATWLSGKAHKSKSDMLGCMPPYDFKMVFWTICPHCQKMFAYYQRNFMARCDGCGKTFFAFKLHQQAVPSRYLSTAPNNSPIQPCQQHGRNMDSMVHATQTDELIREDECSDGDRMGCYSETRSNVVQISAVHQTRLPSFSADNSTTGSMTPDPLDLNSIATQNLSKEDASVVMNTAVPFSLNISGKRKQDDGTDNSYNRNSCDNKRQRKSNSLSDAISSGDKMFDGNVAGTDNKSEGYVSSEVANQEERSAAHDGSQQEHKNETTDIGNPTITYECPDFFDFEELRDINNITVNQIWAIYDDHDFLPRVYAQINHVNASNLEVQLTWLVHNSHEVNRAHEEFPVACGNFCVGETIVLKDPSMYFSHTVSWTKGKNRTSFYIHPNKGEIWALYKELDMLQTSEAGKHQSCNYDVVEVSDICMNNDVIVSPLIRIEGFVSLFAKDKDKYRIMIASTELIRFSHSIPFYKTKGNERVGVAEGLLKLDTATLPCDLFSSFLSISLESYIDLSNKRVSELINVTYPDSEFHNFDEDRSRETFVRGQIWALYNETDTFPNIYARISKVEKEPFKVYLTWLKAYPLDVEKLWVELNIPLSCGNFEIQNVTAEQSETCAFSHLVGTSQFGTGQQVKVLPKVGEVWAIYMNWERGWVPSSHDRRPEYAIGEIKKCLEASMLFSFLTKVDCHVSVFKPDIGKGVLEIPMNEKLRFSHRILSFRLTKENGSKLCGLYELDPPAVLAGFLQKDAPQIPADA